jgi:hypothetical protein
MGGGAHKGSAYSQAVLAPALREAFPEVLATARLVPCLPAPLIGYQDRHFYEPRFYWADSTVFDVFTFPLTKGNPKTALADPYSVLLTEDMAHKYFGDAGFRNATCGRTQVGTDLQRFFSGGHFRFLPRSFRPRCLCSGMPTKEIGIRKLLGASVANVTALLSKDFVKLVLLANLIAWPTAWFAISRWLENFAYRIEISWWIFALAGGLALVIALLTVSTQAIRAALANPVEALRCG